MRLKYLNILILVVQNFKHLKSKIIKIQVLVLTHA